MSDIVLLIDRLYCIDLFSCIAASLFNKLTYLLTYCLHSMQSGVFASVIRLSVCRVIRLPLATSVFHSKASSGQQIVIDCCPALGSSGE